LNTTRLRRFPISNPGDLLDALSIGIVVLDAQLCVIYANSAAQDALAFRVNQTRGRSFGDFSPNRAA
jgi:PAS domain-containing protein